MLKYKELTAYKKAFKIAMELFEASKNFPSEEKFALTSQMRRSSRSVCSNIAEGYRKRIYKAHFVSKATDADMENSETMVWIDFALECKYIPESNYTNWKYEIEEVGRLLNHMIEHPEKYLRNPK
ncbi:MAG: four helix bundle protein [Bacteroidota bacterium]